MDPAGEVGYGRRVSPQRGRRGASGRMATASLAQGKIGLGRALLTLAVAGLLLGTAAVLVLATSDHAELRGWEAAVALLIGWATAELPCAS